MKKVFSQRKFHNIPFYFGLLCVAVMAAPYLILGQDSIFTYHDQLDGEMIAYILQAKHLFRGGILPEFMNGADKTALTMPAPGLVLLFLSGNYFAALVLMQLLGSICGYVGMYLLVQEVCDPEEQTGRGFVLQAVAAMVALLYAYLPFLPVYGLSQYGIPLLVWCFLQLKKGKYKVFSLGYITVFTLCSSLVLAGFGVLGAVFVWLLLRERKNRLLWSGFGLMLLLYMAENFRLLGQMLTGGALSHKAEYVLAGESFFGGLVQGFLEGGQHSQDFHKWILAGALLAAAGALAAGAAFGALRRIWKENEKLLRRMGFCAGFNFLMAFLAALWNSGAGVALRTRLSALGAFQVQRLLWLSPCFWYLLLACTLVFAWRLACSVFGRERSKEGRAGKGRVFIGRLSVGATIICCAAVFGITGLSVLFKSNLKPNIQKMRNPEYGQLSYRDYYAVGVMEQVQDFLGDYTGQEPEEYRVVSLGIDPAAALYHGFYCLDGYSNNYSLEYKHSFRSIIAPELEKSDYLKGYYDDWGNRCYLMSAETPGYYTIEKGGFYFQDYSLNTEALREMGGRYLLSAAYIANAEETGLVLLHEEPFETEDSYYRIFVYGIA